MTSTQNRELVANRKADSDVTEYLIGSRGFSEEVLDFYEIGYVTSPISTLRNRITCPIRDLRGDTKGYSARKVPWDSSKAKYKITAGFTKSEYLYGLYESLKDSSIQENNFIIVTEGNFNVLALKMMGFPAVAAMGLTLSDFQLFLLGCFTTNVVYLTDGDTHGQNAAPKVLEKLTEWGFNGTILKTISGFNDSNEILVAGGDMLEMFVNRIERNVEKYR